MSDHDLDRWLGSSERDDRDIGCDAGFAVFDDYCDAVLRGDAVEQRFAGLLAHLANCAACREDTETLLAILRDGGDSIER